MSKVNSRSSRSTWSTFGAADFGAAGVRIPALVAIASSLAIFAKGFFACLIMLDLSAKTRTLLCKLAWRDDYKVALLSRSFVRFPRQQFLLEKLIDFVSSAGKTLPPPA